MLAIPFLSARKSSIMLQQFQCYFPTNQVLCFSKPSAVFKPRTVSQQTQLQRPSNPSAISQQIWCCVSAIPVPCPSNPSVCQHSCPHQTKAGHSNGEWGALVQALAGTGTIFWQGGENPTLCQFLCHLHRGARKPCVWSCSLGINCAKCFICVETQLC